MTSARRATRYRAFAAGDGPLQAMEKPIKLIYYNRLRSISANFN